MISLDLDAALSLILLENVTMQKEAVIACRTMILFTLLKRNAMIG